MSKLIYFNIWYNFIFMFWSGYWFSIKYWTSTTQAVIQIICFLIFSINFTISINRYEKALKWK